MTTTRTLAASAPSYAWLAPLETGAKVLVTKRGWASAEIDTMAIGDVQTYRYDDGTWAGACVTWDGGEMVLDRAGNQRLTLGKVIELFPWTEERERAVAFFHRRERASRRLFEVMASGMDTPSLRARVRLRQPTEEHVVALIEQLLDAVGAP